MPGKYTSQSYDIGVSSVLCHRAGKQPCGIFQITLDVGHAFIHDGLPEAIAAFGDRIHHIHLDDALNGKDHLPVGEGELDPSLYAEMLQPGKTVVATMEVGQGADGDRVGAQLVSRDALRARFGGVFT